MLLQFSQNASSSPRRNPLDHHSWGPPDVLTRGCEESGTIGAGPLVSTLDTPKKNWMFPPPKMNESNLKMDGKLGVWKMIFSENPGAKGVLR